MKNIWLIARTVLTEAVRRKEIYVIVILSVILIAAVMTVDFFKIEGLTKFYREIALKIMSISTAITCIILSARQLPREFSNRTIYPLLAKPVSRVSYILGKLTGVMLSAVFCFALFMTIFVLGTLYLGAPIHWTLFLQFIYLQMIQMLILATLSFWLSLLFNLDAAITTGILFYGTSSVLTSAGLFLYDFSDRFGQIALTIMNYVLPQLTLFDLSAKNIHAEVWTPLPFGVLIQLTLYGLFFSGLYWSFAYFCFRRKPL